MTKTTSLNKKRSIKCRLLSVKHLSPLKKYMILTFE